MELLTSEIKDGTLTLFLHGNVDSSNAPEVEKMIDAQVGGCDAKKVVLDLEDLKYISSAGLRVILRLRKNRPELNAVNASSEVYEIFDMTGFTEMIPITKGFRKLSVDGCEIIGQGSNGLVYRLDKDTIVKVYRNPDSLPEIKRERELARKAFVLGIPTAIPYDVARVGNSYGSVFELLNAKSFSKLIKAEPENVDKYVGMFVDLLKKIHSTEVKPEDMPDMKAVAVNWVNYLKDYLAPEKWAKLKAMTDAVPVDYHMMHGDYHTKNVMLQNGEVLLIDMDTLCYGSPIFEFASVFNAFIGFNIWDSSEAEKFQGISFDLCKKVWEKTLHLYFNTDDPAKLQEVEDKSAIMGYTRILRRFIKRTGLDTDEKRAQAEFYKKEIETRLDRVDNLIL